MPSGATTIGTEPHVAPVQGGDHAIVVRSTRCWREMDSNDRFRGKRRRDGSTDSGPSGCCGRVSQLVYSRFVA